MGFQHNPVTHRLELLRHKWQQAMEKNKECRIIRWHARPDETEMVHAFIEVEASEHGELPDIFIRLESAFSGNENYSIVLLKELEDRLNNEKEALEGKEISLSWIPIYDEKANRDKERALLFLNNLGSFIKSHPGFDGRLLVVNLVPAEIENTGQWERWLIALIEAGIPEQLRIVIMDVTGYALYAGISNRFPQTVITLMPELKMDEVMRQTAAAAGNPTAPDVQFRNCFLAMSEAAGKQDLPGAEQWGAKALAIARKAAWPNMQVAVYLQLGNLALGEKEFEKCMSHYNDGLHAAREAYASGDAPSGTLVAQCYAARAAAFFSKKEYTAAAEAYKAMAETALEIGHHLYRVEGWRMAALCYRKGDDYDLAWESNWEALHASQLLEEEIRKNSTLPYVGKELLELASSMGKSNERRKIHEMMEQLAGTDWEQKLTEKQVESHVSS